MRIARYSVRSVMRVSLFFFCDLPTKFFIPTLRCSGRAPSCSTLSSWRWGGKWSLLRPKLLVFLWISYLSAGDNATEATSHPTMGAFRFSEKDWISDGVEMTAERLRKVKNRPGEGGFLRVRNVIGGSTIYALLAQGKGVANGQRWKESFARPPMRQVS